jgi:predicted ferric reductase
LGPILIAAYAALAVVPAALAAWLAAPATNLTYDLGRSAALSGFAILAMQPILAARWKWLSRPFGLDVILRFHRTMALTAGALILAHPALLSIGAGDAFLAGGIDWYIWVGIAVLFLAFANVAVSLWRKTIGLDWQRWRGVHDVAAPILLAGAFVHSWLAGADLNHPVLRTLWVVLIVVALGAFALHRLVMPVLLGRHGYRVSDVRREAEGVWTLQFKPPEGHEAFDYQPGQFHFLTLRGNSEVPEEEHHFTISSSPTDSGLLESTIKAIGDYTSTIGHVRPGDTARAQGPFGRFSCALHPREKDLVFIVGGIGITPIMSMLRWMRDRQSDHRVLLLYGNRTAEQIVFRRELDQIQAAQRPALKVVHVLSDASGQWDGESGYIDREILDRYVGRDVSDKTFYVCGPTPLRKMTLGNLKDMGVPDGRIRMEIFRLLG